MVKKQIIVFIILAVLIFVGVIVGLLFLQKRISTANQEEIFSLSATVSVIDAENNFLIIEPQGKENEIKVILSQNTKLVSLKSPFSVENPPQPGVQFTPEQTEITIKDFKEGDEVFIKTLNNISGKAEFGSVELIQILP
jgi:hypothetical protein